MILRNLLIVYFWQYIHPTDGVKLGQAELVVIDEAAAIPLPLVKSLLGPYLVFMASTINGLVTKFWLLIVMSKPFKFCQISQGGTSPRCNSKLCHIFECLRLKYD